MQTADGSVSEGEFLRARIAELEARRPVPTYSTEHITKLHGDPVWQAIWRAIKDWDVSRTGAGSYHAPTGEEVTVIYEAVQGALLATHSWTTK